MTLFALAVPRGTRAWPADLAGRGRSPYRIQESLCAPWRWHPFFLPAQIELDRMKSAGVIVTLWSPLRYQRCGIRRRICIPPPTGLDNNVIVLRLHPPIARSPLTTVVDDSIPPHHFHPALGHSRSSECPLLRDRQSILQNRMRCGPVSAAPEGETRRQTAATAKLIVA